MSNKNKKILFIQRLLFWFLYLFSGSVLYSQKEYLFSPLITFAKVIYPLSIFWLQIRIKNKNTFLSINASMSTSQLWYNLLPVLACFLTVIITVTNTFLFISNKFF